jgi:hypothetical protein
VPAAGEAFPADTPTPRTSPSIQKIQQRFIVEIIRL